MPRFFRIPFVFICLAAFGFGQTAQITPAASNYVGLFDTAYAASKPPVMQPLYAGTFWGSNPNGRQPTQAERWAICRAAQVAGYVFDEEIDGLGWDPYSVMAQRELYGDTWEPAGLGNVRATTESPTTYSGIMPPGQIKVSTLLSDYPAFPVPAAGLAVAPPPIPRAAHPVGIRIIPQVPSQANYVGDIFKCAIANDGFAVAASWSGTSGAFTGTWTKQALELGMMIVWTKIA